MRLKGQLASADVVIAAAALALAASLVLNAAEFSIQAAQRQADFSSGLSDAVAASIAEGANMTRPTHCFAYSNGTTTCSGFSCPVNVFVSQRMVACSGTKTVCLLEVKTCD